MKRFIFILISLVIVGGLAFAGYKYYQNRQEEIANLNKMKLALADNRKDVYAVETELRKIVLAQNHRSDIILSRGKIPPDIDTLIPTIPADDTDPFGIEYWLNHPEEKLMLDWFTFGDSFFQNEYQQYKDLLFKYNSLALEINFMAEKLGEPPVLLLEAYEPDIK